MKGEFVDHYPRGVGEPEGDVNALRRWAHVADLPWPACAFEAGKLFLGRAADGRLVGLADDRHCITVAGSRAGKGASVIVPNLCLYPGSVLCLDPKGENAALTARRRGAGSSFCEGLGQPVFVLDPFATVPHRESAAFNPLDLFDLDTARGEALAIDDAALIAAALVVPGGDKDAHWDESARSVIEALILHVLTHEPPERRTLPRVRQLLMNGEGQGFMALLQGPLRDNPRLDGVITATAAALADLGNDERSSILSTARRNTRFLDSPPMKQVLERSDFRLEDLKHRPMTLYLCLPAARMHSHARWLRLMVGLTLAAMERETVRSERPVLFLMDEFAALGRMESIETAAGLMAGFGVKLWPILQDLTQLKRLYRESWETFLGNAGLLQFFGNTDITTLEHVSRRLGKTKTIGVSQNERPAAPQGGGLTYKPELADLLQPAEIELLFARDRGTQIALLPGQLPWALRRVPYWDPVFDGKRDWAEGYGNPPPTLEDLAARRAGSGRRNRLGG